ncbi:hypothetical protein K402DRAFT_394250 [Aulographum hederae CBS 113979]|uniref:Uncharacterized protein n=1 Tax=Aulographum hederae CBS 113979 TaxID=1176131 RepID=A0A6G1GYJ7_9PEZI|nr:hypothetical protein K402DRAFT_394250 [Aulographum hederae CBS 113979]
MDLLGEVRGRVEKRLPFSTINGISRCALSRFTPLRGEDMRFSRMIEGVPQRHCRVQRM